MVRVFASAVALFAGVIAQSTYAQSATVMLVLQDHRFQPDVITVPAGQRVRIDFSNRDGTADDFECETLHIDKDIGPHGRIAFTLPLLKPGTYAFKAELHAATAQGRIVAVAP